MIKKTEDDYQIVYEYEGGAKAIVRKNYPGPIAINHIPSKECDEYHKSSYVQINMTEAIRACYPDKNVDN